MSIQAYQRAQKRESKIWPAFLWSAAFNAVQKAERDLIYGLYARAYLNMHTYLADVEETGLADLLADYNNKLAELSVQETLVLNSIIARRYLAGIDVLMNDRKLATRELKRQAEEAEWDAKMGALATDRAALETLRTRLESEKKKTEARIAELQAQIIVEEANLALAEIEKVQKEIAAAEMDLKILRSAIDIARIQMSIVEEGMNLIETELRKQRLISDIAELRNKIGRTATLEAQLEVTIAGVAAARAELATLEAELEAILQREAIINAEIAHQAGLIEHMEEMGSLRESLLSLQTTERVRKLEDQVAKQGISTSNRLDLSDLDVEKHYSDRRITTADTGSKSVLSKEHIAAAYKLMEANIAAARSRMETIVVTELTHAISAGSR
jgi:chromosome segregation ATPase